MSSDDNMVMLSALQHYLFCPQQCALIHVEGLWSENYLTASERDGSGRRWATRLSDREGWWRPFPVEYKRGKPKSHRADEVQLCALLAIINNAFAVLVQNQLFSQQFDCLAVLGRSARKFSQLTARRDRLA